MPIQTYSFIYNNRNLVINIDDEDYKNLTVPINGRVESIKYQADSIKYQNLIEHIFSNHLNPDEIREVCLLGPENLKLRLVNINNEMSVINTILNANIKEIENTKIMQEQKNSTFEEKVLEITQNIANLLIEKNKNYGNSALNPKRIFSKSSDLEQLLVRIDDKLSRISNLNVTGLDSAEDTISDLIGYLILLKIKLNQ